MTEEIKMEGEDFREKLDKFRVEIVQALDLDRQFIFCYLRSKSVLDEEDCELIINAGAGRQQKVSKFLDVLACKGPEAFRYFLESVEIENPTLYEKLTGKRAVNRKSTLPVEMTFGKSNWIGGPALKEIIDFDRQYLAKQLEKTTGDLQMLTYVHSKTVQEKSELEQKIIETAGSLEEEQRQTEELKEEMKAISAKAINAKRMSAGVLKPIHQYVQELVAENADKGNSIISLQQRLLYSIERAEQDKSIINELQKRQENLLQQIRDLTINYDWERRNSKKMTEKMRRQNDQIRQGDDLRREIFELKLKLADMQEQRDDAREELKEFRRVTEALNAKYDTVCQEKDLAVGMKEEFSGTLNKYDEQIESLEIQLKEAGWELKELKTKCTRQSQEINTLREQRTVLLQERESAISERSSALKERDEALSMNQELQNSRDKAVAAQIEINNKLQKDYDRLKAELESLRQELNIMTGQCEFAQLKWQQAEKAKRFASYERTVSAPMGVPCPESSENNIEAEMCRTKRDDSDAVDGPERLKSFSWKSRSNSDILNSAYRRINEAETKTFSQHRSSVPLIWDAYNEAVDKVIVPKVIKDGCKNHSPDEIFLSLDNVSRKSAENYAIENISNEKKETCNDEATKESKLDLAGSSDEAKEPSNYWLNVKQKRISQGKGSKSAPPSPTPTQQTEKDGAVIACIVPCISDLSMNLAMKSGSLEKINDESKSKKNKNTSIDKDRSIFSLFSQSSFPSNAMPKHPELRAKYQEKTVAPKMMYGIKMKADFFNENGSNAKHIAGQLNTGSFDTGKASKNGSLKAKKDKTTDTLGVVKKQRRYSAFELMKRSSDIQDSFEV